MTEFARLGDIYRVFAPGRKSHTYVIHHPDDVKRVLVSNHRNYTRASVSTASRFSSARESYSERGAVAAATVHDAAVFPSALVTEFAQALDAGTSASSSDGTVMPRSASSQVTEEMSELTPTSAALHLGRDLEQLSTASPS